MVLTSSTHAAKRLMERFGYDTVTSVEAGLVDVSPVDIEKIKERVVHLCTKAIDSSENIDPKLQDILSFYDGRKVCMKIGDVIAIFVISPVGNVITVMRQNELRRIQQSITIGLLSGQDLKTKDGPHARFDPSSDVQKKSEAILSDILSSLDTRPYGFLLFRLASILNDKMIQIVIDHMRANLTPEQISIEVGRVDVHAGNANALHKAMRAMHWLLKRPDILPSSPIIYSFFNTIHLLVDIGVPINAKDITYDRINSKRYTHDKDVIFKGGFTPVSYFHFHIPRHIRESLHDHYLTVSSMYTNTDIIFSNEYW